MQQEKLHIKLHDDRSQQAIQEAEVMIREHRKKIARLERAIKQFKENAQKGEPWPGSSQSVTPPPTVTP